MAANKQQKVYLIPEGETRDSHTYHYTVVKTKKFIQENFDVVEINVRGSRSITLPDSDVVYEIAFSKLTKVRGFWPSLGRPNYAELVSFFYRCLFFSGFSKLGKSMWN